MTHIFKLWLLCLQQYLQLALFRSTPARLPYNPYTIVLTLVAYTLVGFILLSDYASPVSIILQITIEVGILFLISLVALTLVGKRERLVQSLSALIGVNLLIGFISVPVFQFLPPSSEEQVNLVTLQVTVLILVWNLAAISLIFKRSFEISTALAAFIAFNYFLLNSFIGESLR